MRATPAILAVLCGLASLPAASNANAQAAVAASASADSTAMDPNAILILNRMEDLIGSLSSVSYVVRSSSDVVDLEYGPLTRFGRHEVYMTGPDHMLVNSITEKRHQGYWYNGERVVYYSFTENNYGIMDAPDSILATIETIHEEYGVDFPAADFFYPTFTEDLVAQSTKMDYIGTVQMEGRECFRIVASGKDQTVQLWIANDATFLPVKYIITDHTKQNAQFQGTFTEWKLNPDIPLEYYEFSPPPGATPLYILPRAENPDSVQS